MGDAVDWRASSTSVPLVGRDAEYPAGCVLRVFDGLVPGVRGRARLRAHDEMLPVLRVALNLQIDHALLLERSMSDGSATFQADITANQDLSVGLHGRFPSGERRTVRRPLTSRPPPPPSGNPSHRTDRTSGPVTKAPVIAASTGRSCGFEEARENERVPGHGPEDVAADRPDEAEDRPSHDRPGWWLGSASPMLARRMTGSRRASGSHDQPRCSLKNAIVRPQASSAACLS